MTTEFNRHNDEQVHAGEQALPKGISEDQIGKIWLDQKSNTEQMAARSAGSAFTMLALGLSQFQFTDSKSSDVKEKQKAGGEAKSPADAAEARLKSAAEKAISDPAARTAFLKDMADFKDRAKKDGLKDDEYIKTIDHASRLLEAKEGKVNQEQRVLAARGILHNAAHPDSICQIGGTCGVASTEHKVFTKHPSVAADMIASAALKGEWTGKDGKTIKVPEQNLAPEDNFKKFPPSDGQPSYASQLFQITAINDIGQHLKPPMTYVRGEKVEHKDGNNSISYTPEYWQLQDGSKISFTAKGTGVFSRTGGLPSFLVANEIYRLTGEKNGVITNRAFDKDDCPAAQRPPGITDDNLKDIRTPKDMEDYLKRMKEEGKLPVVVCVSGLAVSSLDGKLCFMGQEQDHFVTVDDYKPAADGKPAEVHVHNQWGTRYNGWMKLADFARATTNTPIKLGEGKPVKTTETNK